MPSKTINVRRPPRFSNGKTIAAQSFTLKLSEILKPSLITTHLIAKILEREEKPTQ